MVKGRKIGQTEVTMSEVQRIMELTDEGKSRREIAETVNRSSSTVYHYQKKYG